MHSTAQSSLPPAHEHLKVGEVAARAKRSISTIWDVTNRQSKNFDPRAPRRIRITPRCTRFSSSECDAWLRALEANGH